MFCKMCNRKQKFILVFILVMIPSALQDYNLHAKSKTPLYNKGSFIEAFNLKQHRKGYYRINREFDLQGNIFTLPKGVTLKFTKRGLIRSGRLSLQDSTTIIGGRFNNGGALTYKRRIVGGNVVDYSMSVSVIDSKCVRLVDCKFISDASIDPNCNFGLFVYGKESGGCSDIEVDNCDFDGCCMGFFSNTKDCKLYNTNFRNSSQLFSIETLYDADQSEYIAPNTIIVVDCSFVCNNSDPSLSPVWCSGFRNISFNNCYFETDCTMLFLYCGDLNIGAENAHIKNSTFVMKGTSSQKKNVSCLTCMGRSYPKMKDNLSFGNAVIQSCKFMYMDDWAAKKQLSSCRAISSRFFNNLIIEDNYFDGFGEAISLSDSYKNRSLPTSRVTIIRNTFEYSNIIPISTTTHNTKKHSNVEVEHLTIQGNSIPLESERILSEMEGCGNCMISDNRKF